MSTSSESIGAISVDMRSGFASGTDDPNGIVQFRMNNVDRSGAIDWTKIRRVPKTSYKPVFDLRTGDILFNATNSPELVGKTALFTGYREPVTFSNHFIRIRLDERRADPAYVARYLTFTWMRGAFHAMCRQWVNQASIAKDQLAELRILLPPLNEQRRIAAILDQADALRRKQSTAISAANALSRTMFISMFGDPTINSKGWPIMTLADTGTLERGISKHRPRNDPMLLGGSYPLIQTGDIANSDGYIRKYASTYSEIGLKQSRLWPVGTLCVTIAANIGRTAILTFDACFPDSVVGFMPHACVKTEYVQTWMSFLQKNLEDNAPQFAQKNINLAILRALPIPVPPIELQSRYAEFVAKLTQFKDKLLGYARQLDGLFILLQYQVFEVAQ